MWEGQGFRGLTTRDYGETFKGASGSRGAVGVGEADSLELRSGRRF